MLHQSILHPSHPFINLPIILTLLIKAREKYMNQIELLLYLTKRQKDLIFYKQSHTINHINPRLVWLFALMVLLTTLVISINHNNTQSYLISYSETWTPSLLKLNNYSNRIKKSLSQKIKTKIKMTFKNQQTLLKIIDFSWIKINQQ